MTILVTGGRGKTSRRLASLLAEASIPFVVASRSSSPDSVHPEVRFDWLDDTTYPVPFESVKHPITTVWMVAPPVGDPVTPMKAFIEFARARGVKRFVLLSASTIPAGGPSYGQIHQYLIDSDLEWGVAMPSWFMQNFSEQQHRNTIVKENKVYSATGTGKVPFVAVEDIAAVAFRLVVDEKPHNCAYTVRGPELLSYDQTAEIISKASGRSIQHVSLSPSEMRAKHISTGLAPEIAEMLVDLDQAIAAGTQEPLDNVVETVTGRKPRSFAQYAEQNKGAWQ